MRPYEHVRYHADAAKLVDGEVGILYDWTNATIFGYLGANSFWIYN